MAHQQLLVAMERTGRLTWVDVMWMHFKFALTGIWVSFVISTPSAFIGTYTETAFFALWMLSAIGGTCVSVVGLILSAQAGPMRRLGFRIELVGLTGAGAGPLCYFAISIVDLFDGQWTQGRLTIAGLAYALLAALMARMAIVIQAARRREFEAEVRD